MKHIYKPILYLLIIGFVLSGCRVEAEQQATLTPASIVIGYCPTMKPFISNLLENHNELNAIEFNNAAMALQALNSGTIQATVVGRVAHQNEIADGIQLIRVKDGYTLVTKNQSLILFEELKNINIFTLEEISEIQEILPQDTLIRQYQDAEQIFSDMTESSAILLRWSEVPTSYQLLIPVDMQGNKIPDFRSPHFYFHEDTHENLSSIITELSSGK